MQLNLFYCTWQYVVPYFYILTYTVHRMGWIALKSIQYVYVTLDHIHFNVHQLSRLLFFYFILLFFTLYCFIFFKKKIPIKIPQIFATLGSSCLITTIETNNSLSHWLNWLLNHNYTYDHSSTFLFFTDPQKSLKS